MDSKGVHDILINTASKLYPQYMDELRGMADGSQILFSEV